MKLFVLAITIWLVPSICPAQEPALSKPTKQHEVLKKLVGHWSTTSKSVAQEGQPTVEGKGTIHSRMIGGLWVVNEMSASMGEMKFQGVQTVGYDPKTGKYVGTWIDSMMNYMWQYNGVYNESSNKLILEANGPNFQEDGKSAKYRDVYEFKSPNLILTTSEIEQDGKWVTFMTGEAKRVTQRREDSKDATSR